MFSTRSRYYNVPDAVYQDSSGRQFKYKLLRITPAGAVLQVHTVAQGDRLDVISYQYYGDPEQFWRICDGNDALRPDDLTAVIGSRLNIPNVQK
jgi:hypothetical protein